MHAGRIADSLSWSDKVRRLYIISYVLCSYLVYLVYITNTFITLTNSIQRNANLISVIFFILFTFVNILSVEIIDKRGAIGNCMLHSQHTQILR